MDYCEIEKQVEEQGMSKENYETIKELPLDRDIILVPVRTRAQAELCFELGIKVFGRTMHNGMKILCAPMSFETIVKAVSNYIHKG